jgi:hypothetical protein
MPIIDIIEYKNKLYKKPKVIKEKMDMYIPDVPNYVSNRNGMIYILTGSGGSGKTNLLLNLFKSKDLYKKKFNNLYYFCPESSFLSLKDHPFKKHDKIYHELTVGNLNDVYNELNEIKQDDNIEYSCVIIDDFADVLKDKNIIKQLNKMLIKARHLCCGYIFTLQTYYYFPKILRKQITYISIFKPKNLEEWNSLAKELFNINSDDALVIYDYCFNEPFTHLDVDTVKNIYYKSFNLLEFKKK